MIIINNNDDNNNNNNNNNNNILINDIPLIVSYNLELILLLRYFDFNSILLFNLILL